ncbi:MAG: cation-translocating P-type ATPase [Clostridia bacterium]|nr:cation-translocating P-type ATPase [Clostridia bacterium]
MKYWNTNIESVFKKLNSNIEGLSSEEANKRIEIYGKNEYKKPKKESLISKIFSQFKDISMIILFVAGIISFIMAFNSGKNFIEPVIIFGIMTMNIFLTIYQEKNAEKVLDELSNMNIPSCVVLRDNLRKVIKKDEIVPGDIIELKTGDYIPADARIINCTSFEVDESALTGESEPVEKNYDILLEEKTPIAERKNMIFSSCYVTKGKARAIIVSTGMQTEMGKIAKFLNNTKKIITPLQKKLNKVINLISMIAVIASLVLFILGILRGENIWNILLTTVLLAVAATPETLSLIVTLSLTHSVQNIVKKNGLIKKLHAVETLGSVSVICSDKTGTLTQGKMEVRKIWTGDKIFNPKDNFDSKCSELVKKLAMVSNIDIHKESNSIGNPTEMAIIKLFFDVKEKINEKYTKVHEIPFSSERKMMSVIFKDNITQKYLVLVKGAIDRLSFSNADTKKIKEVHDEFASEALRVISLGSKELDVLPENLDEIENDLKFEGMVGIIDPPRVDAKSSVNIAKRAGIRTIMITGDHAITAAAIAKEIGILEENTKIMSGKELAEISEEELSKIVKDYSVYARVAPEDKLKIVKAWQNNGKIVSMTGDGINDAPAIKASDIGVAMGINGTEVAKNASDLVLTDDNFSTIIEAVHEGRNIYQNIKKTVCFLSICCISEIMIMIFSQIMNWGALMNPIMLLMIDLLGTGIPSIYFSRELPEKNMMLFKPISYKESILDKIYMLKVVRQVFLMSSVTLIAFFIGKFLQVSNFMPNLKIGQTMAFLVLGISSILNIFNISSEKSIFKHEWSKNPKLVYAAFATMSILIILVLLPQLGSFILNSARISISHWIFVLILSLIPVSISEFFKINTKATN